MNGNFISNNWLVCKLCVSYFHLKVGISGPKLGDMLEVNHGTISRWEGLSGYKRINANSFSLLLDLIDRQFDTNRKLLEHFCDYSAPKVTDLGLDEELFRKIIMTVDGSGKISNRFRDLGQTDLTLKSVEPTDPAKSVDSVKTLDPASAVNFVQPVNSVKTIKSVKVPTVRPDNMQDRISMSALLNSFRHFCSDYDRYFSIKQTSLHIDANKDTMSKWLICGKNAQMHNQENYVVLTFGNIYRIAVVFTNYSFDRDPEKIPDILQDINSLKESNQLNMVIIFTDNTVLDHLQHSLHVHCNCILIPINNNNVRTRVSDISVRPGYYQPMDRKLSEAYAAEAFRKLMTAFTFVKDELVSRNYAVSSAVPPREPDDSVRPAEYMGEMSDYIIHKVHNYSYLTRHAIYFEKNVIRQRVDEWLKKHDRDKLGTVIELNYTAALLSSTVYDQCDEIYLLDDSQMAIDELRKIYPRERTLLKKVHVHTVDMYYDGVSVRTGETLRDQKADLIILGVGGGSNVRSLLSFLRNINQWLTPDGLVYISYINRDSVLFREEEHLTESGIAFSAFGSSYVFALPDGLRVPVQVELWRQQELNSYYKRYFGMTDYKTYPFLSASISGNLKDREILDEIRNIDKKYASEFKYGHFICSFAEKAAKYAGKNYPVQKKDQEKIADIIHNVLNRRNHLPQLEESNDFENPHTHVPITTRRQFEAMVSNASLPGTQDGSYTILKLVLLYNRKKHDHYQYHILALNSRLQMHSDEIRGYELVPEAIINDIFGPGTLSPLLILREVIERTGIDGKIFVHKDTFADKEYVVLSEGINTRTISMRTKDFLRDLETR